MGVYYYAGSLGFEVSNYCTTLKCGILWTAGGGRLLWNGRVVGSRVHYDGDDDGSGPLLTPVTGEHPSDFKTMTYHAIRGNFGSFAGLRLIRAC